MTSGKPYPRRHEPPARPHGGTNNLSAWLQTRRGTSTSWTWREQRPVDMVALLGLMLRQNITDQRLIKLMRKPPHPREYRLGGTQIPAHQLGRETRTRKPSWRQGFHFIRYIKQKITQLAATGLRRSSCTRTDTRNIGCTQELELLPLMAQDNCPPRWREPQRSRQRTHNWATKRVGTGRTTSN